MTAAFDDSGEGAGPAPVLADEALAAFVLAVRRDPGPPAGSVAPERLRQAQRDRIRARPPGPALHAVEDVSADGVAARLYRPSAGARGTVVYLHGGTWTIGDLESHDRACRRLAAASGLRVLAVDYRRAPEHPWPAAVDDAVTAVRWAARALRPTRLAVAGDSAGGNLAALACLRLRADGGPLPDLQVLLCPNTDLTLSQPSVRAFGTGWTLDAAELAWGAANWVPDPARRADPAVSPLFAPELAGSPAALIVTAEFDPLRDEGEAYARRLAEAGVDVRVRREPGMIHGFLMLDTVSPAAAAAGERVFADLVDLLGEDGNAARGRDKAGT
jgi:acetyl esterase